jgi:hypothetical protein
MANSNQDSAIKQLLQKFLIYLLGTVIVLLVFIGIAYKGNFQSILAFLIIAGAYFLSGIILGFLFGMPRSEKFRYKNSGGDNSQNSSWYSDNSNLEDVSDWLTKIIIGLSLVNFDKILTYTNLSARNIAISLSGNEKDFSAYALSYGIIIAFIAAGFIISYLWAFTELRTILIKMKKYDLDLMTPKMVAAISSSVSLKSNVYNEEQIQKLAERDPELQAFLTTVKTALNSKPVIDKTDLQKNRWGGKKENNNKKIEAASLTKNKDYPKFYDVKLRVHSTDNANPLKGWVAFFVHDSFGFTNEVLYSDADNLGYAEITLPAYEAFTAGALIQDDATELEIDLNNEKGFPEDFYW